MFHKVTQIVLGCFTLENKQKRSYKSVAGNVQLKCCTCITQTVNAGKLLPFDINFLIPPEQLRC